MVLCVVGVPMSKENSEKSMHEIFGIIALQLGSLLFNKHLQQLSKKFFSFTVLFLTVLGLGDRI